MKKSPPTLPEIECACAALRRAARLVTQIYDEEFRPGLNAAQFALLIALERQSGSDQQTLARALGFDKTTLSRNLRLIGRNGWIESRPARDARRRALHLSPAGKKVLAKAKPAWRRAQNRLQSAMTVSQWTQMSRAVKNLTSAASRA